MVFPDQSDRGSGNEIGNVAVSLPTRSHEKDSKTLRVDEKRFENGEKGCTLKQKRKHVDGVNERDTQCFSLIFPQEVSELQEQLADLMRHLETQQAIASAPDETRQVTLLSLFSIHCDRPSEGCLQRSLLSLSVCTARYRTNLVELAMLSK